MKEAQPVEPVEILGSEGQEGDPVDGDNLAENEEAMEVPFGLMGASFLCNVLQYAVFLGITMIVLIVIHVFKPDIVP